MYDVKDGIESTDGVIIVRATLIEPWIVSSADVQIVWKSSTLLVTGKVRETRLHMVKVCSS